MIDPLRAPVFGVASVVLVLHALTVPAVAQETGTIVGRVTSAAGGRALGSAVVQVTGGGSGTGIAALINGTTDLAMASRPMKEDEKQNAAQQRGAAVVEQPVALDALGVFVNVANPVQQLTIAQVRDIFQGKITNWSAVGGAKSADTPLLKVVKTIVPTNVFYSVGRETPDMLGLMFFALLTVLFNLAADLAYGVLDPRIRYD